MISETKMFEKNTFSQPYSTNGNSSGGGVMLWIKEGIPLSLVKTQSLPIYIHFLHKTHRNAMSNHLEAISKFLGFYFSSYNNITVLGDLYVDVKEPYMKIFYE